MKNLLTVILLFCCVAVFSQIRERGDIELYATIGSNQSGSSTTFTNARNSVKFGVLGDYFFNDRWSLRSGLVSLKMGDEGFIFILRDFETNYIHIPVNANWHFGSTRKWNLNFGLSAGFLTSAEENGLDIKDQIEFFQLGISYGIGYKLAFSERFALLFDLQAFSGLTDYLKNNAAEERNVASSISIGAVFKL